ncbi:hypothetical protein B9Z19DRAFT_1123615 [Tuber borchii]|uniref:Uncharacterized protein n=1 Tax=Tuber borchii TaxID=42251 RepID=A0A2T6ZY53_TUBBO|nr:hypothetical protein B9Z19DRAFT_1123615 [Tuber borchii]
MLSAFRNRTALGARIHTATALRKAYRKGTWNTGIGHVVGTQDRSPGSPEGNSRKPSMIPKQSEAHCGHLVKSFQHLHAQTLRHIEKENSFMREENQRFLEHLAARERRLERVIDELVIENREFYATAARERNERGRWDSNFNLRGAIEKIVERGIREQKITGGGGIQENLNQILALPKYHEILLQELELRGLREIDVRRCLGILYPALSRYAHGNDGAIVLRGLYHPDNELAGLVALMRVQGRWKNPMAWREEAQEEDY